MNELCFGPYIKPNEVLETYEICRSADLEEIKEVGRKIFCENDLVISDEDHILDTRIFYRQLGGIGIGRMTYGSKITIKPALFENFYLIQMPIRGFEKISLVNANFVCTPQVFSIINPTEKSVIEHQYNTEKLFIRIDKNLVEKYCQQILNVTINKNVEFYNTMLIDTKEGFQWLRMISWIYELVSTESHLSPLMVAQVESNLVNMILLNQNNNFSNEIHNNDYSIAPSFIKRVEHFIQENAQKPISVNDMAEYAGISTRSLYLGFRKYRNITPMRHLKEVRLQKVYQELKCTSLGVDKVTNIAFKWGFSHLGHFSTDYKRRYGETPYETLLS